MNKKELFENRIGIVGAGNIGQSIILKLLEKEYPYENIKLTYNGSMFTIGKLIDNNLMDMISSNSEIGDFASILILSVPPQAFKQIGDFNLDDNTLIISFMAGINTEDIQRQTGSDNVVRIIPTGPDTIMDSKAVAGAYGENPIAFNLFELLDIDYYVVDDEEKMNYIAIAGCLPAVYCRIDPQSEENIEAINKISLDFPEFREIAEKCEKLAPTENKSEFISQHATVGGVTQAIMTSLNSGKTMYEALLDGIKRNKELSG